MFAHFTMHTYELNKTFKFSEGIWLYRNCRQIRFFFWKRYILHHMCATFFELPSYVSTMMQADNKNVRNKNYENLKFRGKILIKWDNYILE